MTKEKLKIIVSYLRELFTTTKDETKKRHIKGLVVRIIELEK